VMCGSVFSLRRSSRLRDLHSFPTRRSSDLLRRIDVGVGVAYGTPPEKMLDILLAVARAHPRVLTDPEPAAFFLGFGESALRFEVDRKSTRLNSSHVSISYAVFCLKKKMLRI